MSGVAGQSGRRPAPAHLAVLRGTRRPVKAVQRSKAAIAREKDLAAVYAVHRDLWRALCDEAADLAATGCVRAVYQSLLREIRGQADLVLRLGAALDRAESAPVAPEPPVPSKWAGLLS